MKNFDINSIETERIDWDDTRVVDRIVKQYENFPKAFQKESIQNAWDVRLDKKKGADWKLEIYFYKENSNKIHLIIEDFGTTGMNEKKLYAFLSLWKPHKEHSDAGGQGQGKFVLMGGSKQEALIVETIDEKKSYRCRFLQRGGKSKENISLTIQDLILKTQPLNHQGTRIWIYDIKEKFLGSLKSREFEDFIRESWWQILESRFNAKIALFSKEIELYKLVPLKEEVILLENKQLGNFGRIKRLVLMFYEKPIPEIFQGIRVQRANMMITKIPFEISDKTYQGCFSGYVEFDKDLEGCLKDIEQTDHCNFLLYEPPWKEIKNLVKQEAEKFINKVIPQHEKRTIFKLSNLNEIIKKANQIIYENCPQVLGSGSYVPPIPPKPKSLLRIKYLTITKREVKWGDVVRPRCWIINEFSKDKKVLLKIELKKEGNRISKEEYKIKILAKGQKSIRLSEIGLKKENYSKGKYTLRATLEENRHDIDTKSTSFYLEIKREAVKRGFIKQAEFFDSDELIRNKPINNGIIKINFAHKDSDNIFKLFDKRKKQLNEQIGFYVMKICLDEAINEFLKIRLLKDISNLDLDDLIKEINDLKSKMYYEVYA